MISPQKIELCADGTVKGAMTGTWRKSQAEGKAYDYIRLSLGGVIYKGYFFQQYNEESPAKKVMTFSAIGGNNTCLWGTCTSKYEEEPSEEEPSPPSGGEGEKPAPPVTAKKGSQAISVKASYSKVYGGKAFSLKAKLTKGDGTLSYASDAPRVAAVGSKTGKVEIKGTGITRITVTASETASYRKKQATVTIKVAPKKVSLASVKAKKGGKASVKWKAAAQASGYEIQYAANAKFKSAKRVTVAKAKATSAVIRKLKSKKTYYFRVRAYKKPAKGGKIYGAYSKAGKLKVK